MFYVQAFYEQLCLSTAESVWVCDVTGLIEDEYSLLCYLLDHQVSNLVPCILCRPSRMNKHSFAAYSEVSCGSTLMYAFPRHWLVQ